MFNDENILSGAPQKELLNFNFKINHLLSELNLSLPLGLNLLRLSYCKRFA